MQAEEVEGLDEALVDFESLVGESLPSADGTDYMERVEAFGRLYGWLFPDWEEVRDPRHEAFFRANGMSAP